MTQGDPIPATAPSESRVEWLARVGFGGLAATGVIVLWRLWHLAVGLPATELAGLVERHGAALIGIPAAAALASFLIGIVRVVDGPIEFDTLGLRAKGAGGAIMLWITTFVAVALSVRAVW